MSPHVTTPAFAPVGKLRAFNARARGFTLIEILIVISLIALLAAGIGMVQPSVDSALAGSVRSIGGMVKMTRAEAAQRAVKSRLLICKTSPDAEKNLRFATIAVWQDAVGSNPAGWVPTSSNLFLPSGIFFHEVLTTGAGGTGKPMEMTFDSQKTEPHTSGPETYYYYEFSSDGVTENAAGAKIVLVPASPSGTDGALEKEEEKIGGLVIHQTGATSYARDSNDLKP